VQCGCGSEVEVGEVAILSEAARIYARRRKRCGPRPKPVACMFCKTACEGRTGLEAHLPTCAEAIAYYSGLDISEVTEFFQEAGVPTSA
jgi:hypothetical protein